MAATAEMPPDLSCQGIPQAKAVAVVAVQAPRTAQMPGVAALAAAAAPTAAASAFSEEMAGLVALQVSRPAAAAAVKLPVPEAK